MYIFVSQVYIYKAESCVKFLRIQKSTEFTRAIFPATLTSNVELDFLSKDIDSTRKFVYNNTSRTLVDARRKRVSKMFRKGRKFFSRVKRALSVSVSERGRTARLRGHWQTEDTGPADDSRHCGGWSRKKSGGSKRAAGRSFGEGGGVGGRIGPFERVSVRKG